MSHQLPHGYRGGGKLRWEYRLNFSPRLTSWQAPGKNRGYCRKDSTGSEEAGRKRGLRQVVVYVSGRIKRTHALIPQLPILTRKRMVADGESLQTLNQALS